MSVAIKTTQLVNPNAFYLRFWLSSLILNAILLTVVYWQWPAQLLVFLKGSLLGGIFWSSIQLRTKSLQKAFGQTGFQKFLQVVTPLFSVLSMVGLAWLLADIAHGNPLRLGVVITGFFSYNGNVLSELCFSVWQNRRSSV